MMKKFIYTILFLSIIFLISVSCSKKSALPVEEEPEYPSITEMLDGIQTIINPDYPHFGRSRYALIEEISIGEIEKGEEYMLNLPIDVKVDEEGNIYILDWGDVKIKVYDSQGRFVRTIGRRGQGPGEFDVPASFSLSAEGHIFLYDSRQRNFMAINAFGVQLSSFRIEGFCKEMKADGLNRLYFQKWTQAQEINVQGKDFEVDMVTSIFRTDQIGNGRFDFGEFWGEKRVVQRIGTGSRSRLGPHFIIWNVSNEGNLVIGYNEHYRLSVYSPEGNVKFVFGREFTPEKNPFYKGQEFDKEFAPTFSRILFDENENIWLAKYTNESQSERVYDVFSSSGIFERQIMVDHSIYLIKSGKIYCIVELDEGYRLVKRYRFVEAESL
ncbi:6-bladed beta-propeller [Candidatus Bathyarchaeota archaeon]|nr:6-bladed beta-propeller [Candidatus Bathyarchaeota archaeon]